jgi:glycosyltransferase involved in cell wall biosynthesis
MTFSVIIPLFNKGPFISRCLKSVYSQTNQDFEVIVVNDGSTDDGVSQVRVMYPAVTIINQENRGVAEARNTGINHSKAPYVAFLDADDAWHPNYLSSVSEVMFKHRCADIIGVRYSRNLDVINHHKLPVHTYMVENYFEKAIQNTIFLPSSTVVKRSLIVDNNIWFNSALKVGEDLDFWFRVMAITKNAFYIRNTLVYYSDEDPGQLTRTVPELSKTLTGTILRSGQYSGENNRGLDSFIQKFVLFNLYPYYYNPVHHSEALQVYKSVTRNNLFLRCAYALPVKFGQWLINSQFYRKYFRLYMKLFIKF